MKKAVMMNLKKLAIRLLTSFGIAMTGMAAAMLAPRLWALPILLGTVVLGAWILTGMKWRGIV